jgi:hypothetical protein
MFSDAGFAVLDFAMSGFGNPKSKIQNPKSKEFRRG